VSPKDGYNPFGFRDSSFAAYVKFAALQGEMTVFDRTFPDATVGTSLTKAADNRIVLAFRTAIGQVGLRSRTAIVADQWFQIVVTKNDRRVALYVNGVIEDSRTLSSGEADINEYTSYAPLFFGASHDHRQFLHGKLDEIILYNQALSAENVEHLYQQRESRECRL
jgi:hypothetical protein